MNPTIEKIVNLLFEDLQETEEVAALRDEVMNNCQERFSDLTQSGMTEDEATHAVVDSLKGMEEVLRSYPRKEAPQTTRTRPGGIYDFAPESIRLIEAQLVSEDFVCEPSPDGLLRVETGTGVSVVLENGKLCISHADSGRLGVGVHIRLFNFRFNYSSDQVKLLLPTAFTGDVNVHTTSGDIEWRKTQANGLSITTASGDVELTDAKLDGQLYVQTASGDVEVQYTLASQVEITTASGDITCRHVQQAQSAHITTASGDVKWESSCPDVQLSSISGDVTCQGECARIQCKTTSGDAYIEAASCLERLLGHSTSGDARIRLPMDMQANLRCQSRYGDVRQRIASAPDSPVTVEWSATSGDVTVQ